MAEGLLGGMQADDDEKPEVEGREALATAEAFAAAVAARLAGNDPGVARDTPSAIRDQTRAGSDETTGPIGMVLVGS